MISIIIPLYNAERYISITLDSVISQTYPNWECIVVNDGSTDRSAEIVNEYCDRDSRFIYIEQSNGGPSKARNNGLNRAKGDYIQFLDADDVILPERFETLLKQYEKCEDHVILYSDILLGADDNIYKTSETRFKSSLGIDLNFNLLYRYFAAGLLFIPGSVFFPRKSIVNLLWNEKIKYAEDWELYLRIAKEGFVFRKIDAVLFIYRNSTNGLSKNIDIRYKIINNILYENLSLRRFCSYIYRITAILYNSLMHIKHKRSKKIALSYMIYDRFNIIAFTFHVVSLFYFPFYVLKRRFVKH